MVDVLFNRGIFQAEGAVSVNASQFLHSIASKLVFTNLHNSIALMQGGILAAPIFVIQTAPFGYSPWWTIHTVQYHSIKPSSDRMSANIWRMISLESVVGRDIEEQELFLHPYSKDDTGLIEENMRVTYKFRPKYTSNYAKDRSTTNPISLCEDERVTQLQHTKELEELTGKKRHGLLTPDKLREDYPVVNMGSVINEISDRYTLETEVRKLMGIANEN